MNLRRLGSIVVKELLQLRREGLGVGEVEFPAERHRADRVLLEDPY